MSLRGEQLFNYYKNSPVVVLEAIVDDPAMVAVYNKAIIFNFTPDLSAGWMPGHLRHRIQEIIARNPESFADQQEWKNQMRDNGEATIDVTVAPAYVVIFEPGGN